MNESPASINERLRDELLAMDAEDQRVRRELLDAGLLGDGYHPRMEEVHKRNAARLKEIILKHGWPGRALVGEQSAFAAWRIAQHAIGDPAFQRSCLCLLEEAAARGDVSPQHPAYMLDRIRMYEGKPQIYGTQFMPNEDGDWAPWEIEDRAACRRTAGRNRLASAGGDAPEARPELPARRGQNSKPGGVITRSGCVKPAGGPEQGWSE